MADDIIQDVWIRAIERLTHFKWQSSLKTWLSGIAINCCREYNRSRKHTGTDEIAVDNKILYNNNSDSKMDLQKALIKLPEGYREVLLLHDMEGFKHSEISVLLGIDPGTSKSQLHNARKAIKNLLK